MPVKKKSKKNAVARGGRVCAMMEYHKHLVETDSTYRQNCRAIERFSANARLRAAPARSSVLRIPVVVHVLHNTETENLSLSQIESQIEALNRDFRGRNADQADVPEPFKGFVADTLIEFALAVRKVVRRLASPALGPRLRSFLTIPMIGWPSLSWTI